MDWETEAVDPLPSQSGCGASSKVLARRWDDIGLQVGRTFPSCSSSSFSSTEGREAVEGPDRCRPCLGSTDSWPPCRSCRRAASPRAVEGRWELSKGREGRRTSPDGAKGRWGEGEVGRIRALSPKEESPGGSGFAGEDRRFRPSRPSSFPPPPTTTNRRSGLPSSFFSTSPSSLSLDGVPSPPSPRILAGARPIGAPAFREDGEALALSTNAGPTRPSLLVTKRGRGSGEVSPLPE